MPESIAFISSIVSRGHRGLPVIIALIISSTWIPSHYIFKYVYKKYKSDDADMISVLSLVSLTIVLIIGGYIIGDRLSPSVRSLGSTVDINLFWFIFLVLSLGLWAGFLSGYMKFPIAKGWEQNTNRKTRK